jgi:hypothetical protein
VIGVTPPLAASDDGSSSVSLSGFLTVWKMGESGRGAQILSTACGDVVAPYNLMMNLSIPINIDSTLSASSRREMSACTRWGKLQIVGTSL